MQDVLGEITSEKLQIQAFNQASTPVANADGSVRAQADHGDASQAHHSQLIDGDMDVFLDKEAALKDARLKHVTQYYSETIQREVRPLPKDQLEAIMKASPMVEHGHSLETALTLFCSVPVRSENHKDLLLNIL